MKPIGLIAAMEKGFKYASDDVLIKECRLNNGKKRHKRVIKHMNIWNGVARRMAKDSIRKEMEDL